MDLRGLIPHVLPFCVAILPRKQGDWACAKYTLTLLAGVAFGLAAIQVASAADLPRKAPAYVPPAPPPFSWTGFYGGIHAGWGWSDSTANVSFAPVGTFDSIALDQKGNGVIRGAQIGYNWQFAPSWVLGVEGDISGTGIHDTTFGGFSAGGVLLGVGFTTKATRDVRWLATARAPWIRGGPLAHLRDGWRCRGGWEDRPWTFQPDHI